MIELTKYERMNKALHDPDWTAKADLEFLPFGEAMKILSSVLSRFCGRLGQLQP
jgi:hypothetical protein